MEITESRPIKNSGTKQSISMEETHPRHEIKLERKLPSVYLELDKNNCKLSTASLPTIKQPTSVEKPSIRRETQGNEKASGLIKPFGKYRNWSDQRIPKFQTVKSKKNHSAD
jgi:hypothetical protein